MAVRRGRLSGAAFPRSRADLLATVTPGRVRGPAFRRVHRGRYVPATADAGGTAQRIVEAASRAPDHAAVGGWAGAWALGVDESDGLGCDGRTVLAVPLCIGPRRQIRPLPGVALWYDRLPPEDVVVVDGVAVTSPSRTCFDGMRRAENLVQAVVFADRMLHAGLVDLQEIRAYVAAHQGWRGVPQARRALDLADTAARNGWETRLRMVWTLDAALPRPLCNPPVFDLDGYLLGYPDLLDADAATVGEYDGSGHRDRDQHHQDNIREELFEHHGLVVTRASSMDFRDRRSLAARMLRAHRRGLARDRHRDRWTLEPPPDWGGLSAEAELRAIHDELDATWTPPW
jgi:hypothetical protein